MVGAAALFVFNHESKLNPILIMKLLRGKVHGRGEEGGCERWVPETRFGRDLVFRWAL